MEYNNNDNDLSHTNKFFLVINSSGYILKTNLKADFDVIKNWGNILFADIVENSNYLQYKIGTTWFKKKISHLPISRDSNETGWYDVNNLDLKGGSHIQEINITQGGSKKGEIVEPL